MNAATHHGLPRVKPATVHRASSQKTLPETISGVQNSHIPIARGSGSGRTSQAMERAAAPMNSAQNTGHGRWVSGQMS